MKSEIHTLEELTGLKHASQTMLRHSQYTPLPAYKILSDQTKYDPSSSAPCAMEMILEKESGRSGSPPPCFGMLLLREREY